MTLLDTGAPASAAGSPPSTRRTRWLEPAGRLVDQRIVGPRGLQARYLGNESRGRAEVAALRKGASKAPGELPEIWELTSVEVPESTGDAPTREEIAVHTAMTLYAVHQQSRTEPMFRPGVGLGQAARYLVGREDENPSARARFNTLVTSTTIAELQHHLRSFVSQLRAKSIPLDHAMLADDLIRFQRPGGARRVRLTWARQYYSLPVTDDASASASTTPAPIPSTPEN